MNIENLGLRALKAELSRLEWVDFDPRVNAARQLVRAERQPQLEAEAGKSCPHTE